MRVVYRAADTEHLHETDGAGGQILGIIARALPREVAAIAHNGTPRRPEKTTRDELASAIRTVQGRIAADPSLLFAYACSVKAHGDDRPAGRQLARGSGISGIRYPDTPADCVYALWCGPGKCDLEEMAIDADGRGTVVGVADVRGEKELLTANMGRIRIHSRSLKTQIVPGLERLLAVVQGWPLGEVCKFASLRD
jgi:hypothetical protein